MNKVILVGNLTKDPELSTTNSGISVVRFTIAVSRRFANAEGEKETDFINCIAWRQLAETCGKFLKKGNKAGVVGTLQTRSYDAQDGSKRYVTEVVADEVEFLSPKGTGSSDDGEKAFNKDDKAAAKKAAPVKVTKLEPVEDDDLPF